MPHSDAYWMKRALVLARKGIGNTQPNPMVGALVLDSSGELVGTGFHPKAGQAHAEVFALDVAGDNARNGTLFVSLEPCAHVGKTPPCVERILQSGVGRVVVAVSDPNPLVNGKGIQKLREAGIEVSIGVLEEESSRLNLPFFFAMKSKRPFVVAKAAVTLDGKIGLMGRRYFISDPACERTTMRLRANAGAILIGVKTLLTDDSLLTVRGKFKGRKPIRAIIDGDLRTPRLSRIFSDPDGGPIWIFCREDFHNTPEILQRAKELQNRGVKLISMPTSATGALSEQQILNIFYRQGIHCVLLEGGSQLFGRFAESQLIDRWYLYLSSRILGKEFDGRETVPLFDGGDYRLAFHSVIRRGLDLEMVASHVYRDR